MRRFRSVRVQGYFAAGFGAAAAVLQLTDVRPSLTGDKNDTITLGLVTLGLAVVMAVGAWASGPWKSTGRSLASFGALGIPALLGLTTAGIAWLPASLLGLVAAFGELRAAARQGSVLATLDRAWPPILLFVLAMIYFVFGVVESGWVGVVGITGGLAVLTSLAFRARDRWVSVVLLLAGAIPFALVTAWTGVTVITAVVMLGVGLPGLRAGPGSVGPQEEVPVS